MADREKINTLHKMHCCSACILKLHMENGIIKQITSAGDIPRQDSAKMDESLENMQRRACARGYAEINHMYSPDRLKYPLKQTKERGDPTGFERISWDEALYTVAKWYDELKGDEQKYGYMPVLDKGGVGRYMGTCLGFFGNSSCGNVNAAIVAALGKRETVVPSAPEDIFNSKYIIIWGSDPSSTLPYLPFTIMKAKEAGIPITVVDTRCTETVGAMATGRGEAPKFISVRPGTDGAMMAAMAYVIYEQGLADHEFIREYCFGFYPNDRVISKSTGQDPVTKNPYYGREYRVPPGESFVEYLESLGNTYSGYTGVLRWAEHLTGVDGNVIEALAIEYANAKPAFIFSKFNGGPQRTRAGMYYSWMMIALSAMTGNINKKGGGFGELRGGHGFGIDMPVSESLFSCQSHDPVLISQFGFSKVLMTGRDGRTAEELRSDVQAMNKIDIGREGKLHVKAYVRGAAGSNDFNQLQNINKKRIAWQKLKYILSYERTLSTTAMYSDIVLPSAMNMENDSAFVSTGPSDTFVMKGPSKKMFEIKSDDEINRLLAKMLGIPVNEDKEYEHEMRRQWDKAKVPDEYLRLYGQPSLPAFEEIYENADFKLKVKTGDVPPPLWNLKAGEYTTETGRINFYSPFLAERGRTVCGVNGARYVPVVNGAEAIVKSGCVQGRGRRRYTMLMITPHVITRADATYNNVPTLCKLKPHAADIHPEDAEMRGISEGDMVYVYNDFGCIKVRAHITRTVYVGVVSIPHGSWYRPSTMETCKAWIDLYDDGNVREYDMPVDVGGCVNTLTADVNSGILDPFVNGLGLNAGGECCEISKEKPK